MSGPPLDNGAVAIQDGRILAVGPLAEVTAHLPGEVMDLGEQVLLPGLINAHCHLDYTMLRRSIQAPASFTAWVQRINALKRSLSDDDYLQAIRNGFTELRKWGTTTVLNIESFPELMSRMPAPPIRTWWFYELIDVRQRVMTEALIAGASMFFHEHEAWMGGFGLSPHAPYTASAALYRLASECGRRTGMPVTTHLAESSEEDAMFRHASGPLYDFMKSLGRDMSDCGHGSSLRLLLEQESIGPDWIVAHMNELDEDDFALLEKTPLHVVHCPESHRYFSHRPFPMDRLRGLGINICLGTDSLASTRKLSLFTEMQAVCDGFPSVSPQAALEMATVNAARALGRPETLGRIAPGARADLICLPIAPPAENVYEEIVWNRRPVDWLMVDGQDRAA